MYIASLDIMTAFDEVAWILGDHNTHERLIVAFSREMSGLSVKASFESVESHFNSNRCFQEKKRGRRTFVAEDRESDPGQCGGKWMQRERLFLGC